MNATTKTLIIAEAGVNHNGSLAAAKELVDVAVWAGADIVKFQTFKSENLVTKTANKATYQAKLTGATESQFDMLKKLELSFTEFLELADYCQKKNIEFLSTAFDEECLDFLWREVGIKRIKIPSGDVTNAPLVAASACTGLPLIISTGMCTLEEIERTLDLVAYSLKSKTEPKCTADFAGEFRRTKIALPVHVLHCTTEYPAPIDDLNLKAMNQIGSTFNLPVGFSDHSEGILAPIAAVAMGAQIIEKHFTLSKDLPGPDHRASLDPNELKQMIASIRTVEIMSGTSQKRPSSIERDNAKVARKSLTARHGIKKGELFDKTNLTTKRPGMGMSPMLYWDVLGKPASKNYALDEVIDE